MSLRHPDPLARSLELRQMAARALIATTVFGCVFIISDSAATALAVTAIVVTPPGFTDRRGAPARLR
jgi:hypothetical protein